MTGSCPSNPLARLPIVIEASNTRWQLARAQPPRWRSACNAFTRTGKALPPAGKSFPRTGIGSSPGREKLSTGGIGFSPGREKLSAGGIGSSPGVEKAFHRTRMCQECLTTSSSSRPSPPVGRIRPGPPTSPSAAGGSFIQNPRKPENTDTAPPLSRPEPTRRPGSAPPLLPSRPCG